MKFKVNLHCHCGSGIKYKKCCLPKEKNNRELSRKIQRGDLNPAALIISGGNEPFSMKIQHASVTRNGQTISHIDQEIVLSTNIIKEESTLDNKNLDKKMQAPAFAQISFPTNGSPHGSIKTRGNATVSNSDSSNPQNKIIELAGNKKEMRDERSGLWVKAAIRRQRDNDFEYFDFLFGKQGENSHAHIALYPDGNGKFHRMSYNNNDNCEIESEMQYISDEHRILPQRVRIKPADVNAIVEVLFSTEGGNKTVLMGINIIDS